MAMTSNASTTEERIERMQKIARLFPSLHNKKGIEPWDPEKLLAWAWRSGGDEQAKTSAKLLLTLWDTRRKWPWGRFDLIAALRTWDSDHRFGFSSYIDYYGHIEPPNKAATAPKRRQRKEDG